MLSKYISIKIKLLFLVLIIIWSQNLFALESMILQQGNDEYPLGLYIEYLEDKDGILEIQDITSKKYSKKWIKSEWKVPDFGFTDSVYWLRFRLNDKTSKPGNWLLEIGNPHLAIVKLFIPNSLEKIGDSFKETGDSYPFNSREIPYQYFLFNLNLKINIEQTYYLQIDTNATLMLPLKIWSKEKFIKKSTEEQYGFGLYYGIMIVMILYNLFIFISVKDKSYLYYVFWVLGYTIFQMSFNGLAIKYFWPDTPWLATRVIPFFAGFACLWGILFTCSFLNTKNNSPKMHKILLFHTGLAVLLMMLSMSVNHSLSSKATVIIAILCSVALLLTGSISLKRNYRPARYFMLAWTMFLFGVITFSLKFLNVFPSNFFTEYAIQIGSALEVILLSLGLADRINMERKEKYFAQKEALKNEKLAHEAQTETLKIQKQSAENLQKEVNRQTVELRQQKNELQTANNKLKKLDELKTQFYSNVSHEFRTPLTLMIGPLEGILSEQNEPLSKNLKEQLSLILRNSERLLTLINQLLDLSKIESGKTQISYKKFSIIEFISNIQKAFQPFADKKGLNLSLSMESDPGFVYFDQEKMEKVFYNLLSNACKFTPKDGEVSVLIESEGEIDVRVTVSDTGPGIPEDALSTIFDRFQQVDGSQSREYEGTGIGLALVKELVELHKGRIEVKSNFGHGSDFSVVLPKGEDIVLEQSNDDKTDDEVSDYSQNSILMSKNNIPMIKSTEITKEEVLEDSKKDLILVIDDNSDIRTYVKSILINYYNVKFAKDGEEGLEKVKELKPSLIISDVMMPKKDGCQLCKDIKKDESINHIPIVLLTAKASEDMRIEGLELGAIDYLAKPFNPRELLARVSNILLIKNQADQIKTNIEVILQKQYKLIMAGEMMGDLFHDIKNIFGKSTYSMTTVKQEVVKIFKLLEIIDNWEEIADIIFKKSNISIQEKKERIKFVKNEIGIEFSNKDLIEIVAGRMCTSDEMLDVIQRLLKIDSEKRDFIHNLMEIAELFDLLERANNQAERISYSVLNQIRGESDGEKSCDISYVIDSCFTIISKRLNMLGIETLINVNPQIACISAPSLHTIILNILNNANDALKNIEQKSKKIKIYDSQEDDYINIFIEDNGPGIPDAIQEKIFERNFSTKGQKGNGIGLFVSQSLLTKIGGNILLCSKPGNTKFVVKLPTVLN